MNLFAPPLSYDDRASAATFAASIIFLDQRFPELASLLTDGHDVGGLEGQPGWLIERKDVCTPADAAYFRQWPGDAVFHAFVDPDFFELGHPHAYLTREEFHRLVRQELSAFIESHPSKKHLIVEVEKALSTAVCG